MARVPYLFETDLAPQDRELLARPINLFRALANSPDAFRLFHQFGEWIRHDCKLDPRMRELAILQVGYLTGSEYEFTHHVDISKAFGVDDSAVQGVIDETLDRPSGLSDLERTVLSATRQLTRDVAVDDGTWAELADHFPPERLVDLVIVVSFYAMVIRVLAGLRIDNEPQYSAHLEQFPFQES